MTLNEIWFLAKESDLFYKNKTNFRSKQMKINVSEEVEIVGQTEERALRSSARAVVVVGALLPFAVVVGEQHSSAVVGVLLPNAVEAVLPFVVEEHVVGSEERPVVAVGAAPAAVVVDGEPVAAEEAVVVVVEGGVEDWAVGGTAVGWGASADWGVAPAGSRNTAAVAPTAPE